MSDPVTSAQFDPSETQEMSVSYQAFVSEAKALSAEEVTPLKADPILAYNNVKKAAKGLFTEANLKKLSQKGVLEERIKKMQQAPTIAQAVIYAYLEVERVALREPSETSAKITRAGLLRKAHLQLAESLVFFGLLKENEVAQIAEGPGLGIDLANDCTMLSALFTRNADTLQKKLPTTPELLAEMSMLGSELLLVLRPKGAAPDRATTTEALRDAQDIRDRLWTLLDQVYDLMMSAGIELVGRRRVEQLVPPLQSRASTQKKPQ
jgi:hypothetical protein